MENVALRWMKEEDIEEVKVLVRKSFHNKKDIVFSTDSFFKDRRSKGLIAVLEKEIVGFIWIDKIDDVFLEKQTFYLRNICVKEEYQNRGIGRRMLLECATIAKQNDIDEITFTSSNYRIASHALYREVGYKIKDTSVFIKNMKEN
ncbi:MAG: GNAT family N-acetyltransferase [Bacilli bacterium]|nr:GNAT family N-acetyltransferase [Bacilli bacterium]